MTSLFVGPSDLLLQRLDSEQPKLLEDSLQLKIININDKQVVHDWKTFLFTFDHENCKLAYFEESQLTEPISSFNLQDFSKIHISKYESAEGGVENSFVTLVLCTVDQKYFIHAKESKTIFNWIVTLKRSAVALATKKLRGTQSFHKRGRRKSTMRDYDSFEQPLSGLTSPNGIYNTTDLIQPLNSDPSNYIDDIPSMGDFIQDQEISQTDLFGEDSPFKHRTPTITRNDTRDFENIFVSPPHSSSPVGSPANSDIRFDSFPSVDSGSRASAFSPTNLDFIEEEESMKYVYVPKNFPTSSFKADDLSRSAPVVTEEEIDNTSVISERSTALMNKEYCEIYGRFAKQGARSSMEDFDLIEINFKSEKNTNIDIDCFGVFDGHMGCRAAQFCHEELLERIRREDIDIFSNWPKQLEVVVNKVFLDIDSDFISIANENRYPDGTCALVAFFNRTLGEIAVANLGDSRALCITKNEANEVGYIPLSRDHSPNSIEEKKRIERIGGWITVETELPVNRLKNMDLSNPNVRERAERSLDLIQTSRVNGELAVSRAIGDIDYKAPYHNQYTWFPPPGMKNISFLEENLVIADPEWIHHKVGYNDKFLVLACDGLFDTLDHQDVANIIFDCHDKGFSLPLTARKLVNTALQNGSPDNVTCLVVALSEKT